MQSTHPSRPNSRSGRRETVEALGPAQEAEGGQGPGPNVRGRGLDQPPTRPQTESRPTSPQSSEAKPCASCRESRNANREGALTRGEPSQAQAQPGGGIIPLPPNDPGQLAPAAPAAKPSPDRQGTAPLPWGGDRAPSRCDSRRA
ncbi:hypothetical protein NDU88_006102 [Pleurodeles waltl]|uniref:Uncharacterized protein n=1 Tax=Pleurodeles waltl TaxID=8319 RepID=A0AAV7QKT8_PLEWA|nr:hypothetical protein NDU88_006102 [Pleurodeles waltl]